MKYLFYVQTIFEMDNPWVYSNYVNNFFKQYIEEIMNVDSESSITIVMGESASYVYKPIANVKLVVVTQDEMLDNGRFDHREILQSYFKFCHGGERPNFITYHMDLISKKLNEEPDIIISRDNAPYLAELYPNALMLYTEVGFISRKPYYLSMYFDNCGMNCGSFLHKNWKFIEKEYEWNEEKQESIETIKKSVQNIFLQNDPFDDLLSSIRKRYDRLLLLPLQFSGFSNIDAEIPYRSQFDVLMGVMRNVDEKTGVIVSTHPDFNVLTEKNLRFVRQKYPNVIYDEKFISVNSSSQYLLAHVDGVINLCSTVGLQTLFWDIPCYQIGEYFASYVSRRWPAELGNIKLTEEEKLNRNKVLYWLLERYIIPPKYYQNGEWLFKYLYTLKENKRRDMLDIYPKIDNFSILAKELIDTINSSYIPEYRKTDKEKRFYSLLVKASKGYFLNEKVSKKLMGKERIVIYGKGSLAYILEMEILLDDELKKKYLGRIDYKDYLSFPYQGNESIIVCPIDSYEEVLRQYSSINVKECISVEELYE